MERIESLINTLDRQISAGTAAHQALETISKLRRRLAVGFRTQGPVNHGGVVVWMPVDFGSFDAGQPLAETETPVQQPVKEFSEPQLARQPLTAPKPPVIIGSQIIQPAITPTYTQPAAAAVSVSEPPAEEIVSIVVELPAKPVPPIVETTKLAETPAKPEKKEEPLFFSLNISEPAEEVTANPAYERYQPTIKEAPEKVSAEPDIRETVARTFPQAPPPKPVREVNELVLDPGPAALNERLQARKTELGDVLAIGPKIADLRKAISVNEKYQIINQLFRGDEDMFERSLRTLNNFGSLPEARFWMQRELVVKMGWNDNDSLVQDFYRLVSRRFM